MLHAIEHFAEDDAVNLLQFARMQQLCQHAIDLIGFGVQIFDHQNGVGQILVDVLSHESDEKLQRTRFELGMVNRAWLDALIWAGWY